MVVKQRSDAFGVCGTEPVVRCYEDVVEQVKRRLVAVDESGTQSGFVYKAGLRLDARRRVVRPFPGFWMIVSASSHVSVDNGVTSGTASCECDVPAATSIQRCLV